MTRRDVLLECFHIDPLPDHLPEARPQASRLIEGALSAVDDPYHPITDGERLLLKRAIVSYSAGNFYQACLVVAEAMMPAHRLPKKPLRPDQIQDFEPLSAADLRHHFERARCAPTTAGVSSAIRATQSLPAGF
jgi:hypothetical protein